jgi:hypothetical protein
VLDVVRDPLDPIGQRLDALLLRLLPLGH